MFEHIFYINLDIDTDRKSSCEEQLNQFGLIAERFPAICPEDAGQYPSIGARGCQLSHMSVVEEAQKRKLDHILILEDDFILHENFYNFCAELASSGPLEYDLFYFYRWQEFDEFPIRIVPIEKTLCTHAYTIHSNYYEKYINVLRNNPGLPIDTINFPSDKKYASSVNIIGQKANISRIDGSEKGVRFNAFD